MIHIQNEASKGIIIKTILSEYDGKLSSIYSSHTESLILIKELGFLIFQSTSKFQIFLMTRGSQSSLWNALSKTNFLSSQRNINKAFYTKYICSRSQSVDSFKSFLLIFFISFPAKKDNFEASQTLLITNICF